MTKQEKNKLKELLERGLDNYDVDNETAQDIAKAFDIELTTDRGVNLHVKIPTSEIENFDTDKLKVTATYKGKEIEVKSII